MRILQIANYSEGVGGIAVQVQMIRDHLLIDGYDCEIFSTKGPFTKRLFTIFKLLKYGRGFDVFHIHACSDRGFLPAIVGISVGRLLRKRIVLTYHGGGADVFFRRRTTLVKFFLSKTDANIVLSGFVGNVYDQYGIPYTVIPNIINFREGVFRKRQEIRPRFINIRSFYETYNIECTLRAFARVQKAYPDASLTLLGDGPLREKMEMCVKERRLRNVTFVGQVKNTEIYKYLDQNDIMISSSRFDNMPVSILEGFNAGLLVIATRVGGIPYMIQDGENGMLFEDDDDFGLAERMIKALENQVKTKDMIIMAHQSLEKYSWRHCYFLLIKLYTGE